MSKKKSIWEKTKGLAKKVGAKVEDASHTVGNVVETSLDKAEDLAEDAWDTTKDATSDAGEFASRTYVKAKEQGNDVLSDVKDHVTGKDEDSA
jgi:ElaB/YqjD/DUF883 family membrane-anchored ribosome-binding protein